MTLNVGAVQTAYGQQPATLLNGQLTRFAGDEYRKSVISVEKIRFGTALVYSGFPLDKTKVRQPMQTQYTLTFSADLITGNTVNGDVKVTPLGGTLTATSLTATPFNTNHLTTMNDLAVKIAAVTGVRSATVTGTNNRDIVVLANGDFDIELANFVVTGGASQATASYTAGSDDTIEGVAQRTYTEQPDSNNDVFYESGDTLIMLRKGGVAALTEETLATNSTLYTRFAAGTGTNQHRGVFRATAGSAPVLATPVTGVEIEAGATAGNIAKFEINKP